MEGQLQRLSNPRNELSNLRNELSNPPKGAGAVAPTIAGAVLLREKPAPSDEDIDEAMTGNICRCGTYPRIRKAIHRAAAMVAKGGAR